MSSESDSGSGESNLYGCVKPILLVAFIFVVAVFDSVGKLEQGLSSDSNGNACMCVYVDVWMRFVCVCVYGSVVGLF